MIVVKQYPGPNFCAEAGVRRGEVDETPKHPVYPLARHRSLRPALWIRRADATPAAVGGGGRSLPAGVLCCPDVLAEPGCAADGAVPSLCRYGRPGPPRICAP